jgi:molybdate transport system regulatory protein
MQMSARNQLAGRIKKVKVGSVMTEVVMQVGDQELVAVITSGSAKRMKLRVGDAVFAIIKATEVMVAKE